MTHDKNMASNAWGLMGALSILFLVFFGTLLTGRLFSGGDIVNAYLPWKDFWRQCVSQGYWPLWNPLIFAGAPFQADIQVGQFYPPNWLFLLMPASIGYTVSTLLHFGFGAWGMARLAGRMSDSGGARFAAVAVFLFSGFFISRFPSGVVLFVFAGAWMPWIVDAMIALTDDPRIQRALRPMALIALQLMAGAPQIAFYTIGAVLIWLPIGIKARNVSARAGGGLLIRRSRIPQRYSARAWLTAGLVLAGAGLLAAIQLGPSWEYTQESFGRAGGARYEFVIDGSMSARMALTQFAPFLYGDPGEPRYYWGGEEGFHELNVYVGWMALMLGALGFFAGGLWARRRDLREERPFRAALVIYARTLIILSAVLCFGGHSPIFRWFYTYVPGFNLFRDPARILVGGLLAWSLLTAAGWDLLIQWPEMSDRVKRRAIRVATACGALSVGGLVLLAVAHHPLVLALGLARAQPPLPGGYPNPLFTELAAHARMSLWIAAAWATAAAAVGIFWTRYADRRLNHPWRIRVLTLVAGALLVADLGWYGLRFMETEKASDFETTFYPDTELVQLLRERTADGSRVLYDDTILGFYWDQNQPEIGYCRTMKTGAGDTPGFAQMRGYNPMLLRRYAEFANHWRGDDSNPFTDHPGAMLKIELSKNPQWFGMWNVGTVLSYMPPPAGSGLRRVARFEFPPADEGFALPPNLPTALNVYENPNALGRGWLADPVAADDGSSSRTFARMARKDFDPKEQALVVPPPPPPQEGGEPVTTETVEWIEAGPNAQRFQVHSRPGRVLVTPTPWHPGWQVHINGRPAPLLRANHAMMAVSLPGGAAAVHFAFRPSRFVLGAGVSLIAWLSWIGVWFWGAQKNKINGRTSENNP